MLIISDVRDRSASECSDQYPDMFEARGPGCFPPPPLPSRGATCPACLPQLTDTTRGQVWVRSGAEYGFLCVCVFLWFRLRYFSSLLLCLVSAVFFHVLSVKYFFLYYFTSSCFLYFSIYVFFPLLYFSFLLYFFVLSPPFAIYVFFYFSLFLFHKLSYFIFYPFLTLFQ